MLLLPLLALSGLLGVAVAFSGRLLKHVVVATIRDELAVVQMNDVGADSVQEIARMTHHQQRLRPPYQVVLHPAMAPFDLCYAYSRTMANLV